MYSVYQTQYSIVYCILGLEKVCLLYVAPPPTVPPDGVLSLADAIPHSVGLDIDLPGNYYPPTQGLRNGEAFRKGVEA